MLMEDSLWFCPEDRCNICTWASSGLESARMTMQERPGTFGMSKRGWLCMHIYADAR